MNQFPAVCSYAQPDIFIPYGWLDFNQAGLRSWMEEGIVWENSSPLQLLLFESACMFDVNPSAAFKYPVRVDTQLTFDQKMPSSACDK